MECILCGFCWHDALGQQQLGDVGGLVCQTQKRYIAYRRNAVICSLLVTCLALTDNNLRHE